MHVLWACGVWQSLRFAFHLQIYFFLCEGLKGKWKRKKHEEIRQVNRLCTVIFNTPLLLFKACCCFYLAALLPSSKPNLVQASLGGPLYWIFGESGSISTCLSVLLRQEETKKRSALAFLCWILIWFAPIRRLDTPLGGDLPLWLPPWQAGTLQQELFYSLWQLPVGFTANRSKTFLFRLTFVHFWFAAEQIVPLVQRWLAPCWPLLPARWVRVH